jgi:hypothetical protein
MTFIYVIAGFLLVFFSLQFLMVFRAKRSKGIKISGGWCGKAGSAGCKAERGS